MSEKFKIIEINEQDHGCEGIPEGQPVRDDVVIRTEGGKEFIMAIEDELLISLDLNEGDEFTIAENGEMKKITE